MGSSRHRVLVTRRLPEPVMARLLAACELEVLAEEADREQLIERIADKQGLLATVRDRIDEPVLAAAKRLEVVANFGVGYDNIDVGAAKKRGIVVTNTPDVLTEATAELTIALLLAVARRVVEGDRLVRSGAWTGWQPLQMLGTEVFGSRLGILGLGRIGRAVAVRARALGTEVVYWGRRQLDEAEESTLGVRFLPFDELLGVCDFVSIHVAYSEGTHHLVGARELRGMKKGAFLVNTARGPVVDEKALVASLAVGHLGGAALDVFEREPRVEPGLLAMEQVVLLPHLGSATLRTRQRMGMSAVDNLLAVLEGRLPLSPVE